MGIENVNNDGKNWQGLDKTSSDSAYQAQLDAKVNSVFNGKEKISVNKLKNNSLFKNLTEKGLKNFETIAGLDGDDKTISATEYKMLLTLADGKLEGEHFNFDATEESAANSALNNAEGYEINYLMTNLSDKNTDLKMHITHIDTSKYNKNKPMAERLSSSDNHEVMNAINERLETKYIDKSTGKKMNLLDIVTKFSKFINEKTKQGIDNAKLIEDSFTKETGIPVSGLCNVGIRGKVPEYTIGKWKISTAGITHNLITNTETGETFNVYPTIWKNSTKYTVPNSDGYTTMVYNYDDNKGTSIKFNRSGKEGGENIAPMKATVTTNGNTTQVDYGTTYKIDPDIYHFIPDK